VSQCEVSKKSDPNAIDCATSKGKPGTVTRMLDGSATTGSSLWATGHLQGGGTGGPSSTWRFAEGNTGSMYQDVIDLLNPQTAASAVRVTFYVPAGAVVASSPLLVGAFETATLDVRAAYLKALGCATSGAGPSKTPRKCQAPLAGIDIGVGLQSSEPIVAERTLSWGSGQPGFKAGYDVSPGVTSASAVAHFAYASTAGGDQALLAVVNPAKPCPGATQCVARVSVTTYSDSGIQLGEGSLAVAAGGRATLPLSTITAGNVFSVSVRSTTPIVAELTQYVGGPASSGQHPGFDLQGSSGSTQQTAIGLQFPSMPILVRAFNPTGSRMFVRVSASQSSGPVTAPSGYWVGGRASLDMTLAEPGAGAKASTTPQPIAVTVTCSGVCISAVLEGARGAASALPAHAVPVALSSAPS
jgi:hypothetical protein